MKKKTKMKKEEKIEKKGKRKKRGPKGVPPESPKKKKFEHLRKEKKRVGKEE